MLKLMTSVCMLAGMTSGVMAANNVSFVVGDAAQQTRPTLTVSIPTQDSIDELPVQQTTVINLLAGLPEATATGVSYNQNTTVFGPALNAYSLSIFYERRDSIPMADLPGTQRWHIRATAERPQDHLGVPLDPTWSGGFDIRFNTQNLLDQINDGMPLPLLHLMPDMEEQSFDIIVNLGTLLKNDGLKSVLGEIFQNTAIEQNGRNKVEKHIIPGKNITCTFRF